MLRTIATTFLFVLALASPAVAGNPAPSGGADLRIAELRVEMHSDACPVLVRKALQRVDGVLGVEADYETRSARIEFAGEKVSVDELRKVIKDQVGLDSSVKNVSAAGETKR